LNKLEENQANDDVTDKSKNSQTKEVKRTKKGKKREPSINETNVTDEKMSEKEKNTENGSQNKEKLEECNISSPISNDIRISKEEESGIVILVTEDNTSKREMTLKIMNTDTKQINEEIVNDTESQEKEENMKKTKDESQNKEQLKQDETRGQTVINEAVVNDTESHEKEENMKKTEDELHNKEQLKQDETRGQTVINETVINDTESHEKEETKGQTVINESIVNDMESQEKEENKKKNEDELQNKEHLKEDETRGQTVIIIDSNGANITENTSANDVEKNVNKANTNIHNSLIQGNSKPSDANEPKEMISDDSKDFNANSSLEKEQNINSNSNQKIEDQKPSKSPAIKPEKKAKKEKKNKTVHKQAVLSETKPSENQEKPMDEKVDKEILDENINDHYSENKSDNIVVSKEETLNNILIETNIKEEEQCNLQLQVEVNNSFYSKDKLSEEKNPTEEKITTRNPISLETTENIKRCKSADDNAAFIPNKSMQNEIKEAIREIENTIEIEDVCNLQQNTDQAQRYEKDLEKKELNEEKTKPKLMRKGSTKYQRRVDNSQGSGTSGKIFHITKLNVNEMMTTSTLVSESELHKSPSDNLDSILSNITITYQELGYCGSNRRKTEKIKILKQKLANEKSLKDTF